MIMRFCGRTPVFASANLESAAEAVVEGKRVGKPEVEQDKVKFVLC
jgi:hypothetical protein